MDNTQNTDQSLNKVVLAALTVLEPTEATKYVVKLLVDEGCHERQDCDILVRFFFIYVGMVHINLESWLEKTQQFQ